jgi:glutaconate CoA-transferase subunit B
MTFTLLDKANYMISSMARLLKDAESAFMGVASFLPFMAIILAKRLYNPDLIWYSIVGYNPNPKHLPLSTVHPWISKYCDAKLQLAELFDISARGELDVVFLAGAQIDQRGYLNNSHVYIGERRVQFPGGAGGALLHATAKRPIVWQGRHDTRIFVKEVQRITAAGKPYRVFSPLCIFRLDDALGRLVVESIHPWSSFEEVKENTGFEVNDAPPTPEPSDEEIELIERIDPHGIRKTVLE